MDPKLVAKFMEEVVQPISKQLEPWKQAALPLIKEFQSRLKTIVLHAKSNEIVLFYLDLIEKFDWNSVEWKNLVIYFTVGIFVWELFLEIRQRIALSGKKPPKSLTKIIDQATFTKANAYNIDKWNFKQFSSIYSTAQILYALYFDFFALVWVKSAELLKTSALVETTEVTQSLVFAAILIVLNSLLNIPMSLYSTFVVEARHAMNKTTFGTWLKDQITTLLLVLVIGLPLIAGFLNVVQWAGKDFGFYVWVFMGCFQLFFLMIFPTFIQPLFNKFTPLPKGSLRSKIEALAARLKFPLKKLFVVDGSRRSAHSNAYFYGFFGYKRIVIYDTLIEQSTEDEVLAVLAHELGHWYYNHVLVNLITAQVQLFIIFYLFSLLTQLPSLFLEFGFGKEQPVLIGFLLFQFVFSPVDSVMTFFMNYMTRAKEFQADAFAKRLGYTEQLKNGLITLNKSNLSNVNPDYLYSMYHHSHPPLVQRLAALEEK